MPVSPIPDSYPRLSPYLCVHDGAAAIDFYAGVFGAEPRGDVMTAPDGRIGHAELGLGDSVVMLSDEWPEMDMRGPLAIGGTAVTLHLYVEDVDAVFAQAVERGATVLQGVQDQFYGDRAGQLLDPFGHRWNVATHIEDITPEEMARRAQRVMGAGSD